MNSQVDFGARTPTFGLTEYFLGDVVLTCKYHTKTISLFLRHAMLPNNTDNHDDRDKRKVLEP